jgi:anthranilate synthase component 1
LGAVLFVVGDPAAIVVVDGDGSGSRRRRVCCRQAGAPGDARRDLRAFAETLRAPRLEGLPSLTGGLMGVLSYEAAALLDGHPTPSGDVPVSPIALLVVDRAVVFDHWRQRLQLVAHVPEGGYDVGVAAIQDLAARLAMAAPAPEPLGAAVVDAPGVPTMPDERYTAIVGAMKEHIAAGDIYQGVPSRRVSFPAPRGGFPIYRQLRVSNPAPYMFFVRMLGLELAGSSPEPLVRVEGRTVTTRPIAGTRPRGETDLRDRLYEHELLADPKERAEHAMLVDLARNDLGRVCTPGTVRPTEPGRRALLEGDAHREHSGGRARRGHARARRARGHLPGRHRDRRAEATREGDHRGARAHRAGPYAGAVGYCTFAGDLDFCITIRTAVVADGAAHVQTGAGVVADSDPQTELRETKSKALALLPAVLDGSDAS